MIELRWVVFGPDTLGSKHQLEWRVLMPSIDASGGLCPGREWSNWQIVPTIDGDEAALEDLVASGGIVGAP